jgi:hypothetical protein
MDTPEEILVLYEKGPHDAVRVMWVSEPPGRGRYYVLNADLNGDGGDELVVAQTGQCDKMGRIRLYSPLFEKTPVGRSVVK